MRLFFIFGVLMLNKFLLISCTALLTACAHSQSTPLKINPIVEALPDVAIEFETTVIDTNQIEQHHRWKFWRNKNRIEIHNLSDNSGDVWTKSASGKIEYERVFHNEKQIIDYRDSDLEMIGENPNWLAMATLLNPAITATLLSDNQEDVFGQTAINYKNSDLEITWLTQSQIPAMIQRFEKGYLLTTKILSLKTNAPLEMTDYGHISFADIGDKESDSFIKSILPKLKGAHEHEH